MNVRSFIDMNVLVYSDDRSAPAKRKIALDLLEEGRIQSRGVISTQVLQEYFVAATRKLGVPAEIARRKVEPFAHFQLVPIDLDSIIAGIDRRRLHGFPFCDALIVRARSSATARCSTLNHRAADPCSLYTTLLRASGRGR